MWDYLQHMQLVCEFHELLSQYVKAKTNALVKAETLRQNVTIVIDWWVMDMFI